MNRNTVEIIIMCVVLIVLMIGMVFVIKTKYMPEVEEVDDYSYEENLDDNSVDSDIVTNAEIVETDDTADTENVEEGNIEENNAEE